MPHWQLWLPRVRPILRFAAFVVLAMGTPAGTARAQVDASQLAASARQLLKENCHRCHGEDGANEGGFNFVLDRGRLTAAGLVVPERPEESRLYQRVQLGEMPADTGPLAEVDQELLARWISAGAPDFDPPRPRREFLAPSHILAAMRADLEATRARDRPFVRYFTLTHLFNAGLSEDELQSYRHGLSKLVNSLSWGSRIVVPRPVDEHQTVLRIDVRDYKWNENQAWDLIAAANPYGVSLEGPDAAYCCEAAGTSMPHVRADWFVATAARPPLYHAVARIPSTDVELEERLVVDVAANLEAGHAARAGFSSSGVSQNNRLIERHESPFGAYWKSYDFAGSADDQNLFAHPLGPDGKNAFVHDGGEIIFNLPNGLQAYMLVDAVGRRIDKGPTNIVSDPRQADRAVVNGLSCMSCHAKGMIDKQDQIRDHVQQHRAAFSREEYDAVAELYPPAGAFAALLAQDADRFAASVALTGAHLSETESIVALAQRFEEPLDLALAAAEAGVPQDLFATALDSSPELARALGVLTVAGGTVNRDTFVEAFPSLVEHLGLGQYTRFDPTEVAGLGGPVSDRGQEFTNSIGMRFVLVPAGEFDMGSPAMEQGRLTDEVQHRVRITRPYFIGIHEVTQSQYERILRTNPSQLSPKGQGRFSVPGLDTSDFPVESVSWDDAVEFCRRLSALPDEREQGRVYRLPTEAQWEFACRAGTTTAFHFGAALSTDHATFSKLVVQRTTAVGSYVPNALGLFDVHGNVWEWCQDYYGDYPSDSSAVRDPSGPETGTSRVVRGGSWHDPAANCRSARRNPRDPTFRHDSLGFRVVAVQSH